LLQFVDLPQDAPAGVARVFLFINHLILQENGGEFNNSHREPGFGGNLKARMGKY
jgi:hypothetical protein